MGEVGAAEVGIVKKDKRRAPRMGGWKTGLVVVALVVAGCGDVVEMEIKTAATAVAAEAGGVESTWDTWEGEKLASSEVYQQVVDGLVEVNVDDAYFCSGAVVKVSKRNAILVTAAHCIERMKSGVSTLVTAANGTWKSMMNAMDIKSMSKADQDLGVFRISLEEIDGQPPEKGLKWDEAPLEFGAEAFEVGFPVAGQV
ncbi:MAG: hypothetical protein G01um101416_1205 [Microgenomates group bacterium Gr01-1014_16]|nr:MAG: hypothetical protein G01um101416_1205 [Microgenomates group bacterium Gr01-1014_16]